MVDKKRCYDKEQCPYHKIMEEQVRDSLPRWVFLSAFGTFVMVAIIFAGWHVASLKAFDERYYISVKELHKTEERNGISLAEIKTMQIVMSKKLDNLKNN